MGTKNEIIKHIVRDLIISLSVIRTDSIKFEIHWIHRIRHMFGFPLGAQLDGSPKQPENIFRKKNTENNHLLVIPHFIFSK